MRLFGFWIIVVFELLVVFCVFWFCLLVGVCLRVWVLDLFVVTLGLDFGFACCYLGFGFWVC